MTVHKLMVASKIAVLLSLLVLSDSSLWAQNFNDADGRNASNIANALSKGKSKMNTQQALNPGFGTSQSDLQIRESAKNLALQTSNKSKKTEVSSNNTSPATEGTTSSPLEPGREATRIANSQTRGGKSEEQIQKSAAKVRQTAEDIRSQAISQESVATKDPTQLLLDAKLARRIEVKKQRDNYEAMIKTNFNRFQKIRYRDMHYNGMSYDYSSFNQLFTSIKKR